MAAHFHSRNFTQTTIKIKIPPKGSIKKYVAIKEYVGHLGLGVSFYGFQKISRYR